MSQIHPRAKRTASPARASASSRSLSPAVPEWANDLIHKTVRTVAWEGQTKGLGKFALHPSSLRTLHPAAPGGPIPSTWRSIVHALDRKRVETHLNNLEEENLPATIDYRIHYGPGSSSFWVRHRTVSLAGKGAKKVARGFVQDIQAEKDFQLESLRVSEREQNRIGQDLHDDLCQVLAGVSCLMRVMEARLAQAAPTEVQGIREINQQVIEAMARTRALTHGLFPGKVQIADIRGALLELASQIRARFNIEIRARFEGRFPKHSTGNVIQIFRIAQESVTNAIKHGEATSVDLHLKAFEDEMVLKITDNGTGLKKGPAANSAGVGFHIMQFRAGILGGRVEITNVKPQGVCVCLSYPFES